MAFMKYADARVVHPSVTKTEWLNIRTAGKTFRSTNRIATNLSGNLVERAADMFKKPFNPNDYMLTHSTIVASVDTYSPTGIKTGSITEDGQRVNRKYSNFRVKSECDSCINNNLDAWDRGVLVKAYPTFIGGHSFVEHVQVEELSKGRIIDAVARDVGNSVYIDILVANETKHRDLIAAIKSGKMSTLSMGCTTDATQCTKCGHVAADETELCSHVKYQKGNTFFDEQGRKHRVAELCGHASIDPHGGVQFIEASWVETPAFTGAVLRNVLDFNAATARQAKKVLATPPTEWSSDSYLKAAKQTVVAEGWDDEPPAGDDGGGDEPPAAPAPAAPKAPFQDVEDGVYNDIVKRVRTRLEKDLAPSQQPASDVPVSTNETINKQARMKHLAALGALVRTARSDADLVDRVAAYNRSVGVEVSVGLYRAALAVGATTTYTNKNQFRVACGRALGRAASDQEFGVLLRLGTLLAKRRSQS